MDNDKTTAYYQMLQRLRNGEITEDQWMDFCHEVFVDILEENKDVLLRLKNC